uniref:Uncharacterized protein n=1 Tax=Cyclophora tenuis TaxID=216820 RepID=A0A7S1CZD5_CYCTE
MEDDKSHVSELTEDRTQRHFDAAAAAAGTTEGESPGVKRYRRPPSYIGVASDASHPKLDTIDSSARRSHRRLPDETSVNSYGSASQKRLSVAQRARLEAERSSGTPVRIRAAMAPPNPLVRSRSSSSQPSFLTNVAKSISDAIDSSVLGVPDLPSFDEDVDERASTTTDEEENEQPLSEAGSSLSLQERQQIQRAKQLAFLREQGLLKSNEGMKGGAGQNPKSYTR